MSVEPTDTVGAALLGLAARGVTHPMLAWWLRQPHPSFGGRRPATVFAEQPDLVADIARLAARNDFRSTPR